MDGSLYDDGKTPSSYEYNVKVTRYVVDIAHTLGVSVEGELGTIGSIEKMHAGDKEEGHGAEGKLTLEQLLTDPDQAVDFVTRTGVDALAIAIGTSHGAYKFTKQPTKDVLVIDQIFKIHERLPNCHLVMHGSSSVPQELLQIVNQFGGAMKPTWGVPVPEIQRAITAGVRKVNVDTDLRLAMTGALRKHFVEKPADFDPRTYLQEGRDAMKALCKARMTDFGQAGHAKGVPHVTCEEMAKRYARGELGENAKPMKIKAC
jgi:fructose-bisphosphate aldolase class II